MERLVLLSGILKLVVPVAAINNMLGKLPEEAKQLPEDKFHITLMHQMFATALRHAVCDALVQTLPLDRRDELMGGKEDIYLSMPGRTLADEDLVPPPPPFRFGDNIYRIDRPAQKRSSWITLLKEQGAWRRYVNQICYMYGLPANPEPYRVFHVSLANLSGNPFHSVGDVDVSDLA